MDARPTVGLVVAGAGARGAYEAGALSVLVPRMAAEEAAPTVLVGTSAGALNVVGLAGLVQHGWSEAAQGLVELWASVRLNQVADVSGSLAGDLARYLGQLAGLPARLPSLLDTRRQQQTLAELLPLDALHDNVASGPVDAVAVATTSTRTGGTVVFVEKKPSVALPGYDPKRNITYVQTRLSVEHVLASSAVPVAFRPVRVDHPSPVAGWHVDGGVRLNTPLKPALALGCDRVGVVATHPGTWPTPGATAGAGSPDVFRAASLSLQALLADRMVEDLHTLSTVNTLTVAAPRASRYREIPFLFAGPPTDHAGAIGALANEVFAAHYAGRRGLRHRDVWLLDRMIGGAAADHGELLSFLLFDAPFTRPATDLGARHAAATLPAAARRPWRTSLVPPSAAS